MQIPDPSAFGDAARAAGWQPMQLDLSGPAEPIAAFRVAARGPGGVPWAIDSVGDRQALLARLIAHAGGAAPLRHAADLLAAIGQAQEAHHARVLVASASPGGGSGLDLHRLLPIPRALLQLGADHPDSLLWQDGHWGTREAVRRVEVRETRDPKQYRRRRLRYRFWMLDGRLAVLAAALRQAWPALLVDAAILASTGA